MISWALVLSLPVMSLLAATLQPHSLNGICYQARSGFAYVSIFSMPVGSIVWYRGLAQGGIAVVGQLQLLQPFFGFGQAAVLLGENASAMMIFLS